MIPNRIIRQWLEYPRLAPHSLSIFRFRSMDGTPVHAASRRVARLAALSFPPKGKNVLAPMQQISKERDLFFWRIDFGCGDGRRLCDRERLGNGFTGERMINPKYGPEPLILFTKPVTLLMRCFQAHLNIVLTSRVALDWHMFPRRFYPRTETNEQLILHPHKLGTNREQIGNKLPKNSSESGRPTHA